MLLPTTNEFIFSAKYRLYRHVLFWLSWHLGWTCFLSLIWPRFIENYVRIGLWIPAFLFYTYPVSSIAIPKLLLKGRYLILIGSLIFWLAVGWHLSVNYLRFISLPVLNLMGIPAGDNYAWQCFLCVITATASFSALSLGKQWLAKQKEFVQAQQEKSIAQLKLLKAQLHPHFLFNTLNNMYGFALHNSPKTPQMILKLSSLLRYMLYECKGEHVLLEKEVEVMKNYIDLEKERYGDNIDISVNVAGEIEGKYLSPLLILPFLENAFKHGTSEQFGRPWMSVDISVKDNTLKCKLVNSKNEMVPYSENGVGVTNVRKRLDLLYAGKYDLKLTDEGDFFVVALVLELKQETDKALTPDFLYDQYKPIKYEDALSLSR